MNNEKIIEILKEEDLKGLSGPIKEKPEVVYGAINIQQLSRRDRDIYESGRSSGFKEGKAFAIKLKLTKPIEPNTNQSMWDEIVDVLKTYSMRYGQLRATDDDMIIEASDFDQIADRLLQAYPKAKSDCPEVERPIIKNYFKRGTTLSDVHNTYLSQPELFKYAQALDEYVDSIESHNNDSDRKREYGISEQQRDQIIYDLTKDFKTRVMCVDLYEIEYIEMTDAMLLMSKAIRAALRELTDKGE